MSCTLYMIGHFKARACIGFPVACLKFPNLKKALHPVGLLWCYYDTETVPAHSSPYINPVFFAPAFYSAWTSWPLKMGPIRCPETSVGDYHSALRYTPECLLLFMVRIRFVTVGILCLSLVKVTSVCILLSKLIWTKESSNSPTGIKLIIVK
jgi:hypothetical protein